MMAWKRGVKSLYYCRSLSIQRAETVAGEALAVPIGDQALSTARNDAPSIVPIGTPSAPAPSTGHQSTNYEECLSCQ
jgi:ribonucleoside-diphosphate reductase alpha chain